MHLQQNKLLCESGGMYRQFHGQIIYSNIEHLSNIDEIDGLAQFTAFRILQNNYFHFNDHSFLSNTLLYIKDKNLFVQQRGHNNFFTPDKKLAKIFGHKKNRLWTKIFYETYGITYPRNMDTMLKSDNIRGFVHESLLRSHLTPIYRHCDLKLIISFENSTILEQLIQRVF